MKALIGKNITFLIRCVVSVGLVTWLISAVDTQSLFATVTMIPISVLVYAYFLIFLLLFISAFRWWLLIREISLFLLYRLVIISVYYNTVLPGQIAGEFVKAHHLRHVSLLRVAVSIIFDKVAGVASLFIVATIGLFFVQVPQVAHSTTIIFITTTILFFSLFSLLIPAVNRFAKKIIMACGGIVFIARYISKIETFIVAWVDLLKNRRAVIANIITGVIFHIGTAYLYYVLGNAMHITVALTDWFWIYAVLSIVLLLPITIAGIGLREGTLVGILTFLGVNSDKAIAYSLVLLALYVVVVLVGFILDMLYTHSVPPPQAEAYE